MKTLIAHRRPIAAARGGFTLVEMLVATTLVVMMMLMFTQIYVAAIGSLGQQQAIARNDGKARLVDTLLHGDLQRATSRSAPSSNQGLISLVKDDVVNSWQEGFFYISENDQTNPVDDVLHFTTRIRNSNDTRNPDQTYYFGRCQPVPGELEYNTSSAQPYYFSNHPEVDDGDTTNQVGASRAAEVVYFVRGGNLYRRVLLVRDTDLAGVLGSESAQPSRISDGSEYFGRIIPANSVTTPSYYKAFDYSAYCRVIDTATPTTDSVRFLGTEALENRPGSIDSLGRSMTRFGFPITPANQTFIHADPTIQTITRVRGMPMEYDSSGAFFGRPVHAETGSFQWGWPGTRANPLLGATLTYDVTAKNQLSIGATPIDDPDTINSRETEDLLLSNVEGFDVEVWDPGLVELDLDGDTICDPEEDLNKNGVFDQAAGFVQLGNSELTGYFRDAQRLNNAYGPGVNPTTNANVAARNWVFDTGHPDMWTEDVTRSSAFKPPYRPLLYRLTEDTNRNVVLDGGEDLNGNGTLDRPVFPVQAADFWAPSIQYESGDVVFRPGDTTFSIGYRCVASGEDVDGDRLLDVAEVDANSDGFPDPPNDVNGNGFIDLPGDTVSTDLNNNGSLDFMEDRVLPLNGTIDWGFSDTSAPLWPTLPGLRVTENTALSSVTWEAFDNRVGIQKIRITVRVRDSIEGLPRQFSVIHSFANPRR